MTRKVSPPIKLLTETELELMSILWRLGEGTVRDVLGGLPQARKLAYTSVSTILRILEQKKVLVSRKDGRGHVYVPKLQKDDYEAVSVQHLVSKVFDGQASSLVSRLLEADGLDVADLESLKALLEDRIQKG